MSRVRDAMVRGVVAVASDTSLAAVARLFALNGVSGAPVIEDSGHVLGVITQPDLTDPDRKRSGKAGRPLYYRVWNGDVRAVGIVATPPMPRGVAADVMTTAIKTVAQDTPVEEAARHMLAEDVHQLFVVESGRVIGVLSALDCLRALLDRGVRASGSASWTPGFTNGSRV